MFLRCVLERYNHRLVVESGRPTVVVIFLLPLSAVAIFFMAKSSCADRTILVAKILTNTCVVEQIWLWYISLAWCLVEHRENRPETQELRASRPPCTVVKVHGYIA